MIAFAKKNYGLEINNLKYTFRWTPHARVSATSDIAKQNVETQLPTTAARTVSSPARELYGSYTNRVKLRFMGRK